MRSTARLARRPILGPVALASATLGVVGVFGVSGRASAGIPACSPTITTVEGDDVASFTTDGECVWSLPDVVTTVDVLVVAGGGSGGRSDERSTGGGGGGGVAYGEGVALSGSFVITVGAGGVNGQSCAPWPDSTSGAASSITNVGLVDPAAEVGIVADGGARGAGCGDGNPAPSGGSGGGGHSSWVPTGGAATQGTVTNLTGIDLYGNDGGAGVNSSGDSGGGGGGATSVGEDAASGGVGGDGGEGVGISITGTLVVYGSGGGGIGTTSAGVGGTNAGDGHPEIIPVEVLSYDGVANTGGGGGAAFNETSGAGGSGVVVLRYPHVPTLPDTGSSTGVLTGIAAALVVVGSGLVAVRRRRPA